MVIEEENLSDDIPGGLTQLGSLSGGFACDFPSCGYICGRKCGSFEFLEANFDFLIEYLVRNNCQSDSLASCGENIVQWSCKDYPPEEAEFIAMLNLYNPIAYPSFSFFYGMASHADTCVAGSENIDRISWVKLMGPTWIKYKGGVETLKNLPCLKDLDLEFSNSNGPEVDSGLLDRLEVLENINKLTIRCDGISLYNVLEIFHGSSLPESWAKLVSLRRFTFRAEDLYILLPSIFGGMRNLEHLDVCTNSYGDMLQDLVLDTRIQLCRVPGEVVLCGQRLEEVENCPVLFGLVIEILWGPFICFVALMGALMACEGCKGMLSEVQSSYVFYLLIPAIIFVADIAIDLTLIVVLWASKSSFIMLGIVMVHYAVAIGFFGWCLGKTGVQEARVWHSNVVEPDPGFLDAWFHTSWLYSGAGWFAKVIVVLPLGSILVDFLSFVSVLTGSPLNSLTSSIDLPRYFHARIMIESFVEAPLQAVFQTVAFWLSSGGVLWFDISVGLFTLSMVASFVSILAGMVKFGCKRLENASGVEATPQVHGNGSRANGAEVSEPLLFN
ncbi:hypothetical protein BSKO_04853 [Bryopsis sp. KO-2023]|nr:hypothetical protein BSKO_04853 [Bryopsis sp. KO-2023]